MRRRPVLALAFVLVFLALGAVLPAGAQEATPPTGAFPVTPDPNECAIEPRTVEELAALAAEATPGPEEAEPPTSVEVPIGEPADEATVAAVVATVRGAVACFNAGDYLRGFAYSSDDLIRRDFAGVPEEELAFFAATPEPAAPEAQLRIVAITDVSLLADGRVGAFYVVDLPEAGPTTEYLFFVREGDRWLIDDAISFSAAKEE